jgi:hypothetical protein
MGKIARISNPEIFTKTAKAFGDEGDANFCAPVAVAIITGKPVAEVKKAFADAGREEGKGTPIDVTRDALKALGFKMAKVSDKEVAAIIATYPGRHNTLKHITTHHPRRFPKAFEGKGDFLFQTVNHIAAFVGGAVQDHSVNSALRVKALYRVTA